MKEKTNNWLWVIPFSLWIIGFFGIFWTMNLNDLSLTINFVIDNNTKESIDNMISWQRDYKNQTQDKLFDCCNPNNEVCIYSNKSCVFVNQQGDLKDDNRD